jgi:hypothetical protein
MVKQNSYSKVDSLGLRKRAIELFARNHSIEDAARILSDELDDDSISVGALTNWKHRFKEQITPFIEDRKTDLLKKDAVVWQRESARMRQDMLTKIDDIIKIAMAQAKAGGKPKQIKVVLDGLKEHRLQIESYDRFMGIQDVKPDVNLSQTNIFVRLNEIVKQTEQQGFDVIDGKAKEVDE